MDGLDYRSLFEDAPIGMAVVDDAGRIVEVNAALGRLVGGAGTGATLASLATSHDGSLGDLTGVASLRADFVTPEGRALAGRLSVAAVPGASDRYLCVLHDRTREAGLERFAAVLAHDLAAPLLTAAGFADLLAERLSDSSDPDTRRDVEHVLRATRRLRLLVEAIRRSAELGPDSFTPETVKLRPLLEEVAADVDGDVRLEVDGTVRGDPAQLYRLFQALVLLVLEASPRVRVTSERQDESSAVFVHGALPAETGVGLTIARAIAEGHGATITVDRSTGDGYVRVDLPVR